ncbi:Com family DNA-binding transcriptional regulator [Neisseria musculi]|uniref:Zinc finger LSD1 subclass domain protein n=1 Tax=Neisseria musculi TaxID=1815583 RepID=A0A7H1MCL4_9NEIS|nr:Com family DNA-binding transcriptional regulator [Neisseria musculi]QNT58180.1 zinc finger, LSD1 subclass domain protein [Neisseria musculi]QNT59379.1 zinc finger, LSD1 subclass domain protein [Neisseria musculi]
MKHRCKNCNRLLAVGTGDFEIKCPRCKTANAIRALTTENAAEHPTFQKGRNGCPENPQP